MVPDRRVIANSTNSSNVTCPDSISNTMCLNTLVLNVGKLHTFILLYSCCSLIPSPPAPRMKLDPWLQTLCTSASGNACYNNLSSISVSTAASLSAVVVVIAKIRSNTVSAGWVVLRKCWVLHGAHHSAVNVIDIFKSLCTINFAQQVHSSIIWT